MAFGRQDRRITRSRLIGSTDRHNTQNVLEVPAQRSISSIIAT
jgi:hypothetical protein